MIASNLVDDIRQGRQQLGVGIIGAVGLYAPVVSRSRLQSIDSHGSYRHGAQGVIGGSIGQFQL